MLVVLAIKLLEYQQVLLINWQGIKGLLGVESEATITSGARSIVTLAQKNSAGIFIAGIGGLFVGNQLAS